MGIDAITKEFTPVGLTPDQLLIPALQHAPDIPSRADPVQPVDTKGRPQEQPDALRHPPDTLSSVNPVQPVDTKGRPQDTLNVHVDTTLWNLLTQFARKQPELQKPLYAYLHHPDTSSLADPAQSAHIQEVTQPQQQQQHNRGDQQQEHP